MGGNDDSSQLALNELFLTEVIEGLSQAQKTLKSQYFYDQIGSALFEEITELPEYYPTRTEISILETHTAEIAAQMGTGTVLVEYGAGASTKTRLLLDALEAPAGYVPIDVSETFLFETAEILRRDYPKLPIYPLAGNFMSKLALPDDLNGPRTGFFPGSTLGNLTDDEIFIFLSQAKDLLGPNSQFLLGIDLRKSPDILIPAYDDAAGVTAKFNLNMLHRINEELGANFDLSAFAHEARWNDAASQIEMHLVSLKDQNVTIGAQGFHFNETETIHTENSRKFSIDSLRPLLEQSGWTIKTRWLDENDYFAVIMLGAL